MGVGVKKMGELFVNIKTGKVYIVEWRGIINATNTNEGQRMILYTSEDTGQAYVREINEFNKKFMPFQPEE
jgi:hypothetical protein